MIIDRIRKDMSVIAADDRCIGFVDRLDGDDMLRITCVSAGYGYDHLIPLSWVSDVDKFVYLDKTRGYVAANWENAPPQRQASGLPSARETLAKAADLVGVRQPKAA
jgi:hypothetical protein